MTDIHPAPPIFTADELAADQILQFFHYEHLPPRLQIISEPFCDLARDMIDRLPRNAERSAGLRKLLEAKDCAVRAMVPTPASKLDGMVGEIAGLSDKSMEILKGLQQALDGNEKGARVSPSPSVDPAR